MPSSICTINTVPLATSGTTGINVAASSTITIALVNLAGVNSWNIYASSADDMTSSNGNLAAVNNSKLTPFSYVATFVMPPIILDGYRGAALQFTSVVNGDANTAVTFGIWVLNSDNSRLFFGGESNESNATVGNAAQLNYMMIAIAKLIG